MALHHLQYSKKPKGGVHLESIFLLQLKNGIMLGCQYSLIAIGFSLFFGVLNVVVFCHGNIASIFLFISSALLALAIGIGTKLPQLSNIFMVIIIFGTICITGLIGVMIERSIIRPFRKSPGLMTLLITASAGIVIEQVLKNFFPQGSNPQMFPLELGITQYKLGTFTIFGNEIFIIIVTSLLFLFTFLFIKKTRIGSHIEAISQDFEAAAMLGINVNRGIAITFFLGASLAAVSGFMHGIYYNVFRFDMGGMAGIKGFSASVVGGLGSIFGAIMGGFLMGFVETFAAAYIPGASPYRDVFSFIVVLIFLVFRPSGILGQIVPEKV